VSEVHVHLVVRSLEDAPTKRWTACVDGLGTRTIVHERRDPGPPSSREEAFRWDFLVLRNALERAVAEAPEARHVLLSYHLAESGYVAQQVADTLGLTHVGCASDDDFERDYRSPLTWSGIVFVLRRATCLVIDDAEQERFLRPLTGGAARLELIGRSLGLEEARRRWRGLFDSVFRRRGPAGQRAQKRVLFFVFDGAGCGHLQRMTRLAAAVQGPCAALVVSGHRDASWLTPDDCEYVYLPGFDSLLADKARFWNRRPFMRIGSDDAVALRQSLLRGVVESFAPDVLVVDHLVFGKRYELAEIVREYDCKKYFVMRGIMGDPVDARIGMLGGRGGRRAAALVRPGAGGRGPAHLRRGVRVRSV